MNKCLICGYEWIPKVESKSCPKCKRYDWKEKIKVTKKENETTIN